MTSGSVQTVNNDARGKRITVTYNGKQKSFTIPRSARVVTLKSDDQSILDHGARVFIVTQREVSLPMSRLNWGETRR